MFLKEGAFPGEGKKDGKIPKIMFDKAALFPYNTSCMTVREGIAMLLDLSRIIDRPGASRSFSEDLDLSDLTFGNCKPAEEPVHAEGVIRNTAGVLLVDGTVTACEAKADGFALVVKGEGWAGAAQAAACSADDS